MDWNASLTFDRGRSIVVGFAPFEIAKQTGVSRSAAPVRFACRGGGPSANRVATISRFIALQGMMIQFAKEIAAPRVARVFRLIAGRAASISRAAGTRSIRHGRGIVEFVSHSRSPWHGSTDFRTLEFGTRERANHCLTRQLFAGTMSKKKPFFFLWLAMTMQGSSGLTAMPNRSPGRQPGATGACDARSHRTCWSACRHSFG